MTIVLAPPALSRLFPAYILVDAEGVIAATGPALRRATPGQRLTAMFDVEPAGLLEAVRCAGEAGVAVSLSAADPALQLVGVAIGQPAGVLLCLRYKPADLKAAHLAGLHLDDFDEHDSTVDSLVVNAMQSALLAETKDAVAELVTARDVALEASRIQAEFLANMSHEIRTPLTGILGFAELLAGSEALPDRESLFARRLLAATRNLGVLVDDILDYSALESGRVTLRVEPFPLGAVWEAACTFQTHADAKGLQLGLRGAPPDDRLILGDLQRLRQIVLNLVSNAIKFTDRGAVHVAIGHSEAEGRLRVSVTDTGPGLSEPEQQRIFRRFSRIDNARARAVGGAGLGLAICRALIELMGGRMGVDSRPGSGATFWFEVPAERHAGPPPGEATAPRVELAGRVLVADDVEINRDVLIAALGDGCVVELVSDGAAALAAAEAAAYDLIVLDVHMPGVDGLQVMRTLRAGGGPNRLAPILALTADLTPETRSAAIQAGATAFLPKPLDLQAFRLVVDRLMLPVTAA